MIVILTRHAEPGPGSNPGLSAAGRTRAELLANALGDAALTAIFTSDLRRTKETAEPIAARAQIQPREISSDPQAARLDVLAAGERVLVVGHTNTVPQLIEALGGPATVEIDADEFDRLFVVNVQTDGTAAVLFMRYGPP